jgi:hypothetical protein
MAVLLAPLAARAGVLSRDWANGKLTLHLEDGAAQVEWITNTAFHYSRGTLAKIEHDPVAVEFEDIRDTLKLRGRYMTIEIAKATGELRVSASNQTIAGLSIATEGSGIALHVAPLGKVFGLSGPGDSQRFFFSNNYGMFVRDPQQCAFDLEHGAVHFPSSPLDLVFYYGPSPKEIFEQHQKVIGKREISTLYSSSVPVGAAALPNAPLDSWDGIGQLVRMLNQWSLSAVVYPALNVSTLRPAHGETLKRATDLAAILPLLYGDPAGIHLGARERWTPYLATYLREAYDRGYPLIRPLPVEFSRDKNLDPQPDVFMLGDEVLVAPVVAGGDRRKLKLPRGRWTDLRTNIEHEGNQEIDIEAPAGQVPTFARNGAVLPLAGKTAMELHYFPSLGGEFFLWEPEVRDNSQFHAAPAGDFIRLEMESKVSRNIEWVIHKTKRPAGVDGCKPVRQRSALTPGTWWHDKARNDLHVVVAAEAGADKIVNISF